MFNRLPVIDVAEIDINGQLPVLVHLNLTCPTCGHKFQLIDFDTEIFHQYASVWNKECHKCSSKAVCDH